MKKKILATLLAVALVGTSLVGCGSDKKEETPATGTETPAETIDVALTVWAPQEDQSEENGQWLQTECENFNAAHPEWNITFEYGVCAEGDAKATVTQDVEGAADVYMFANDNITALVASNAIAKLGGDTAEYVQSTNSPAIVDSVSLDGSIYGVPFTTNTWFMYYDKSVFTEDDVKNLDTMLAKGKVAFPLKNSWYVASFFVANGCTLFGDGTDEAAGIDFSGDKAVAVTNYLVDLAANPNFVVDAAGEGLAGFRDGTVGAMFSGSWDYTAVSDALGDNFGAAACPTITINGEEKQMMAFAGSKAIGVNPTSEYPEVAVALARYLGSKEAQLSHFQLRGIVPCNTELLADDAVATNALVIAQNLTFDTTSIIQPFVDAMGNYWTPAENFGGNIVSGAITHDNAEAETAALNDALNATGLE